MLTKLLVAFSLMAACVVLHATGLTLAMRWMERSLAAPLVGSWRRLRLLIEVAALTVVVHLVEITVWAAYLAGSGAMPDIDSALYFSAVTYTTTGYGDLVLPEGWRLVGGIEALTGILMCGWSTGFFFAIFNQIFIRDTGVRAPAGEAGGGS